MPISHAYRIVVIAAAIFTGGCATSTPSPAPNVPLISYRLPATAATATGTLTIEDCTPEGVELSADLVLVATGTATGPQVALTAAQLDSARFRRSIEVDRHPNGTIAAINSEVEDRLPAIIGSVLKTALQVIPIFSAAFQPTSTAPLPPLCKPSVLTALSRIEVIRSSVRDLRGRLSSGNGDAQDLTRRIDALLNEAAALKHNALTASFSKSLPLEGAPSEILVGDVLNEFFTRAGSAPVTLHVTPPPSAPTGVSYTCPTAGALCLPAPNIPNATWQVRVLAGEAELASANLTAPMPQWANPVELPLRVGFAGNRTFAATYDGFGRQTNAQWGSQARGATIAEAVAGYAESVAGIAGEIEGPTALESQKAEIEELEIRQRLNRLRACREILEAGGSACPAEAPSNTQ